MSSQTALNIVFGSMTFGKEGAESVRTTSLDEMRDILDIFQKHGHKEVDTARIYTDGTCEEVLGELEWQKRGLVVETKLYPRRGKESERHTPENLKRNLDLSLKALRTDKVEFLYLHAPDRTTPWEVTYKALDDLHKEGKFDKLGVSNYRSWEVAEVVTLCRLHGWIQPTVYQGVYHALQRSVEPELFPLLRKYGISFYAFSPLSGGFLSGRYKKMDETAEKGGRFDASSGFIQAIRYRERYWHEHNFRALQIISEAAEKENLTVPQVALRWLEHHSQLKREHSDSIIIGASKKEYLEGGLTYLEEGPLSEAIVTAMDTAWNIVSPYVENYWH
ncbi:Aldo/keto reductase [Serendipita vermifera]|nr:Aldo/keto reductase [Serendipita vermifera]